MREVSDQVLLNMAEVTAALAGLFLAGIFFFVETASADASELLSSPTSGRGRGSSSSCSRSRFSSR
jgi:hypothetical protein